MDHGPLGPSTSPGSCWLTYWWTWIVTPWALLDHCSPLFHYLLISLFPIPLHSDVFYFTANYLVWPALFQVTVSERRSCGSGIIWWCLSPLSRLLDPQTSICIRYSAIATGTLWFCCSVLNMWHLLHLCLSWERDPSSVALPEVSSVFFFPSVKMFFSPKIAHFFSPNSKAIELKGYWDSVIVILAFYK